MNEDLLQNPLAIDETRLMWEWARQSELVTEFAEREARAERRLDDAKALLVEAEAQQKKVEASLFLRISSDPTSHGCPKTSDPAIKCAVMLQPEYEQARQAVVAAQRHLNDMAHAHRMIGAVRSGLRDKRPALENIVQLALTDYHKAPQVPAKYREEFDQSMKQTTRRPRARAQPPQTPDEAPP